MKAVSEAPSTTGHPIRPPGLLPLPNERLWKPHEDKYWTSLRKQWAADFDESSGSQNGHDSSSDDHEEMDNVDLTTAHDGTLFRIVLPSSIAVHAEQECDTGGAAHTRTRSNGHEPQRAGPALGSRGINHSTPIADAISLHLPPPAVTKKSRKGDFKGSALNVSVTTSTRTYGDFSKFCPPPYTPRPTNFERSFGKNGELLDDKMNGRNRWAVSKWLFILGFLFPLLWLFGSFLLFTGLRRLHADAQVESQISVSKSDTPSNDTTSHANAVTYMISQEILWSKRCAWAIVLFGVACFITLGVLKAVGM